jgi:SWI/SNF-related matrix-associated actin-dependent regulator of chromatin subfamily A3
LQNQLHDADIVISTYHTLASDFSNSKNSLEEIEWYRLVLDEGDLTCQMRTSYADAYEAHIIRRQSTSLYRTVADIRAKSRWCLTGTPIQNRLEDIGSLLAFLKITPFHSISVFKKSIVSPYEEGRMRRKLAIERFTNLFDALCLRRTTDLLDLPEQQSRVRSIQLSSQERAQYEQTREIMSRVMRNQAGDLEELSTLRMFQVRLQLRILCNHGTWQQMFSWNRRKLHLLDEREAVEASSGRDGEATCSLCKQTMPLFGAGSSFRRYTEHCRHVLCSECLEQSMTENEDRLPSSCPLCSSLWGPTMRACRDRQTSQEDTYFRSHGESSKMNALVEDVMENVWTTKR